MRITKCLSGYGNDRVEVSKNEMFNTAMIKIKANNIDNYIYLGKAEVQELINHLEELKKDIL